MARLAGRRVFVDSPDDRSGVMGGAFYSSLEANELVAVYSCTSRSDTSDVAYRMRSVDNGRSWSEPEEIPCRFEAGGGTGRRHPRGGYLDPSSGLFVEIWTEGVLPTDNPLEGMCRWTLHYSVSDDGGRTIRSTGQVIHGGPEYDPEHHLPGVTVGCNNVMVGDFCQRPLTRSDGVLIVPVQSTPTGPDGSYCNPGGGYTYTDVMCLFGRWLPDRSLSWTASERLIGDPEQTTRGLIEPTIATLDDGSILMVMRGSNDARPELPGYRWVSRSSDGGESWSPARPWTYTDGTPFHSPSSCSQLVPYSDGRIFWVGNLCDRNPRGNRPRYPIVIGEVDSHTDHLIAGSVTTIDDRKTGESQDLTLSNFYVREDRETKELVLYLPRAFSNRRSHPDGGYHPFPLLEYRLTV